MYKRYDLAVSGLKRFLRFPFSPDEGSQALEFSGKRNRSQGDQEPEESLLAWKRDSVLQRSPLCRHLIRGVTQCSTRQGSSKLVHFSLDNNNLFSAHNRIWKLCPRCLCIGLFSQNTQCNDPWVAPRTGSGHLRELRSSVIASLLNRRRATDAASINGSTDSADGPKEVVRGFGYHC
jgi:hypothetical protein